MVKQTRNLGPFRCLKCGTPTSAGCSFCPVCGEALDIECLECGETWRFIYNYAFCPTCGAKFKSK